MVICYNYMILEKLELNDISKTEIFGKLIYRDDYKFFSSEIVLRSVEENRIINRLCFFKKKVNIEIDAYNRRITKITLLDEDKTIYVNKIDSGGTNEN